MRNLPPLPNPQSLVRAMTEACVQTQSDHTQGRPLADWVPKQSEFRILNPGGALRGEYGRKIEIAAKRDGWRKRGDLWYPPNK